MGGAIVKYIRNHYFFNILYIISETLSSSWEIWDLQLWLPTDLEHMPILNASGSFNMEEWESMEKVI